MAPKTSTKSKTTSAAPTATAPAKNTNPDLQLARRPAPSKSGKRAANTSAVAVAVAVVEKFAGIRDPCIAAMVHRCGGTIIKSDLYPVARTRADEHMVNIIKRVGQYSDGGIIKAAHMLQATCDAYRRRGAYYAGIAN
jgi:hypothetical protein